MQVISCSTDLPSVNFVPTELENSMRELDFEAMAAKSDRLRLEKLILEQEHAILKYSSKVTGKYISKIFLKL